MASSSSEERRPLNPDMIHRPLTHTPVSISPQDDAPTGKLLLHFSLNTIVGFIRLIEAALVIALIAVALCSRHDGIFFVVVAFIRLFWNLFWILFLRNRKSRKANNQRRGCTVEFGPLKFIYGEGQGHEDNGGEKKDRPYIASLIDFTFLTIFFIGAFVSAMTEVWWDWDKQSLTGLFATVASLELVIFLLMLFSIVKKTTIYIYEEEEEGADFNYRIQLPKDPDMKKRSDLISVAA